jgi:hypothetical protein
LRENPKLTEAAAELIRRFGAGDAQVLREAFAAGSAYSRVQIARAVEDAAKRGMPVPTSFIADLAEMVEEPADPRDHSGPDALGSLARTANRVTGESVVSDRDLDALQHRTTKGPETEEMAVHNSRIPEAFRFVKAELIAVLRKGRLPAQQGRGG